MSARSYCHVEGKLWKLPSMHFQQRVHRSQGLHFTRPLLPQFSEHQQKTNNVRLAGNNGVGQICKTAILMPNVIAGGCGIMLLLLVLNTPGEVESGDGGAEV